MTSAFIPEKRNRIREGSKIADVVIYGIAALFAIISLYPLYYVLILSLSSPENAITMQVFWWPKGFYLDGYKRLLMDTKLWIAYRNTIFYALSTMVLMLVFCSMAAYTLSSKHLKGRKFLNFYLLVPMYFSGGIIPLFLLVLNLGIYDTPWALILPGAFNIWYIILIKSYFGTIPESLREAAQLDGANSYRILWSVYLPTAKPILAVVALYTIIGVWNGWYRASIFLADSNLQPLQLYLRKVLVEQSVDLSQEFLTTEELLADQKERLSNNQLKYTIIILSSLPMLIAYPYFQKFFVKGVMMGSLKE
ncbi:MAG: carbohydrate ABC transporter permease [Clostridia bacterium]|mgnify:CR=1 FL=1|nr:carbohydrate ABC transporter permease [Clostridia bacterium]